MTIKKSFHPVLQKLMSIMFKDNARTATQFDHIRLITYR